MGKKLAVVATLLLSLTGCMHMGASLPSGVSSAGPIDLYVAPYGNDFNDCSSAHPCATPQEAVNRLPKTIRHQTTVHILGYADGGVATYYADAAADAGAQATLELDGFTVDLGSNPAAGLTVDCAVSEMLAPVTATGFTAGTSTSPPLLTVSGAAWTPSAYKGMFVRVLSGTGAGNTYVIVDNTATSLTILTDGITLDTTTNFDIIQPAVALSDALSSAPTTHVVTSVVSFRGVNGGASTLSAGYTTNAVTLSHATIVGHSSLFDAQVSSSQGVQLAYVNTSGSTHGVGTGSATFPGVAVPAFSSATIYRSYITGTVGVSWMSTGIFYARASALVASYGEFFAGVGSESQNSYVSSSIACYTAYSQVSNSSMSVQNDWCNITASVPAVILADALNRGERNTIYLNPLYSYGSPSMLANVGSGSAVFFSSATATTAPNFISLDNGSTYVTKASIEAGTNKTIFNTSTGALAKEQ